MGKDNVIGLKKPESIIVSRPVPSVRPAIRKNHQTIRNLQNILIYSLNFNYTHANDNIVIHIITKGCADGIS
jgi:hypothetical protein